MSLACCLAAILLALALHRRAQGGTLPLRPCFADLAALLAGVWVYALCLVLLGWPLAALTVTALALGGLWAVNEAKKASLRGEPLVITDLALVWQVLRFPWLYLPFLPWRAMLAAGLAGIALAVLACRLPASPSSAGALWLALVLLPPLALASMRLSALRPIAAAIERLLPLSFNARRDAERYGPLGAALLHAAWHLALRGQPGCKGVPPLGALGQGRLPQAWTRDCLRFDAGPGVRLPHIVLVQAESFCDPRPFSPAVPQDILPCWDALRAGGMGGSFVTSAFGAYTLRTEYAVLSGQPWTALGTDAFHPYLGCARRPSWSLAWLLRDFGYRTVCLHPFHRVFFCRDRAIPNLGFERFATLESFPQDRAFGPYVSDASVAQALLAELERADARGRPLFCFAITMESHGPWLDGRFAREGGDRAAGVPDLPGLALPVRRYLAHLAHADAMLGALHEGLKASGRPAVLGCYGDHLPNLQGFVPDRAKAAPWAVWPAPAGTAPGTRQDLAPDAMGGLLLEAGGLLR